MFIQTARVIVDVHREQARSYRGCANLANPRPTSEVGAICTLIGRDRRHGSIVRSGVDEQTETLIAVTAFITRELP